MQLGLAAYQAKACQQALRQAPLAKQLPARKAAAASTGLARGRQWVTHTFGQVLQDEAVVGGELHDPVRLELAYGQAATMPH